MAPPSMGYNPPSSGVGGYNPTEEDEEGLYDLEPDDGPDDIYNDGDEVGIWLFYMLSKWLSA